MICTNQKLVFLNQKLSTKMKIGTRLLTARNDRKLNQAEMADLLGLAPSTYSRIERNEGSATLEQVLDFSQKLDVPIQDFLPETISINSSNQNGNIGLVMGTINYYGDQALAQENAFLKEKIQSQQTEIENLKEINALLKAKTA